MSFHNNFEQWLAMTERQNCPVCQQLPMPKGMVDIVELPNSWLDAEPVDCLKGACHLVAKQHVIELYELHDDELLALMKSLRRSSARCRRPSRRISEWLNVRAPSCQSWRRLKQEALGRCVEIEP